jgi:peptidyl-prolyl cis-trans isomerase A (cyclophilin A)
MITRRVLVSLTVFASMGVISPAGQVQDIRQIGRVEAKLLMVRPGFPVGEPVAAQLTLKNPSAKQVTVGAECLQPSAFRLRRPGSARDAKTRKNRSAETVVLEADQSFQKGFDLRAHYKELRKPGRYRLSWHCGKWKTPIQEIFIVEPYDPERDKVAIVETTLGTLELTLMRKKAPLHVENFVQLAKQGYYDGLLFDRMVPGVHIESAARGEGPLAGWEHQLPPEIDRSITPGKGLVGAVRRETSMTSATRFFILLDTAFNYKGNHTFFAYVRKGEDVLNAIGATGVLGGLGALDFRPAKRIYIKAIEIRSE